MFDAADKFGSMADCFDLLEREDRAAAEAICWLMTRMVNAGEIHRREAGGDPDKLDSMIEAFEKGYAEAEKQWGGELPELTQRTREATLKKFQDLKDKNAQNSSASAQASAQSLLESAAQKAAEEA